MSEQAVETPEEKAARLKAFRQENMRKAREVAAANRERRAAATEATVDAQVKALAEPVYHIPQYKCSKCGRLSPDNSVLTPGQGAKIQCMGCTHSAILKREVIEY